MNKTKMTKLKPGVWRFGDWMIAVLTTDRLLVTSGNNLVFEKDANLVEKAIHDMFPDAKMMITHGDLDYHSLSENADLRQFIKEIVAECVYETFEKAAQ